MANYDSQKVPDLKALLSDRGLSTAGKKSDLIERLTKDDESKAGASETTSAKLHPEDEIDWDDDEEASAEAAKAAPASSEKKEDTSAAPAATEADAVVKADGAGQPSEPQAAPEQKADIDSSKTEDLAVKPPTETKEGNTEAKPEEEKKEPVSYAKGVAASSIDEEIEKRKKRAARFGMPVKEDDQAVKLLERAKKFGESGPPKGLDEALPERERRKRGREDNDDGGRNKRRGGGGGGRNGGRQGRPQGGDRRRDNRDDRREGRGNTDGRAPNWMSDADRQKAEARKNKFSKPAS